MATKETAATDYVQTDKSQRSLRQSMVWLIVIFVSTVSGFAAPLLIAKMSAPVQVPAEPEAVQTEVSNQIAYIDFEEVVGVLGKTKFRRYLRIVVSLEITQSAKAEVEARIAAKTAVLRNRILMHIAEVTQEDLAGQHGHNQLRRKFHQLFNEILFEDGVPRIQDVLFKELMVQ